MQNNKKHIKDIQLSSSKTHEEVARDLAIARSTYTKILNGHQMPSYKVAKRIANYFDIPLDDIIFGPDVTKSNKKDMKVV